MITQFTRRQVLCTGIDDSNIDPEVMEKMQKRIGETMERLIDQRNKQILGVKDPSDWHQKTAMMPISRYGGAIIDPRAI